MAKNSRKELGIEYRRQCVKDTWIKLGAFEVTQGQIVQALKEDYGIEVDQSTVSRDLAVIKKAMREQTPADLKSFLYAEYMRVLRDAWSAWKRSLEDAVTETSEMVESPETVKDEKGSSQVVSGQRLKASTRKEGQSGNPALLAQYQAALKAVREMFGTDQPIEQKVSLLVEQELEGALDMLQRRLSPDVFNVVVTALAGEAGQETVEPDNGQPE